MMKNGNQNPRNTEVLRIPTDPLLDFLFVKIGDVLAYYRIRHPDLIFWPITLELEFR